jgi:raffinose/stachyose/melibiose transport system permease protein
VVEARDYMLIIAFIKQHHPHGRQRDHDGGVRGDGRRSSCTAGAAGWNPFVNMLVLAGLIIPPAVVPTIWVLQKLGLFRTMPGLILVEVAFGMSFVILLFRGLHRHHPAELDEAAIIDGAGPVRLFSG